jgi:hypothetical protein
MPVAKIEDIQGRRVFVKETNYPFRVRFENIGVSIPASQGIGVAVIGSTFIIL